MSMKTAQEIEKELAIVETDDGSGELSRDQQIIAHTLLWVLGQREDSPSEYYLEK